MPKTVILSAARTPIGKLGGGLASLDATELGGDRDPAALERADVAPEQVQHVVMGQVLQAGQGQIPSRQAQIKAGIPKEVSSETINKVCASGIRAAGMLDAAIRAGDLEVGVGGGMESMSNAPYLLKGARFGFRMGDGKAIDAMIHDGLTNPFSGKHMAQEASEVAAELELTRADMDRWALRSPRAGDQGHRRGPPARGDRPGHDQGPQGRHGGRGRRGAAARHEPRDRWPSCPRSSSRTAPTRPATRPASTTAAARSCSPATSGPRRNGKAALATIIAQAAVADDFPYLARTPGQGRREGAREGRACSADDIDLWEINEAFASVTLNSMRMLGIDEDKVNVNGGAVALGHPIGASGARILGTLVYELRRRGGGLGCAAICSGGGQGDAVIIEVNGG